MGIWNKSPQADPAVVAAAQAAATNAFNTITQSAAFRSAQVTDRWTRLPDQIKAQLKAAGVSLPDGYDVDMNGNVVYTNKTPALQQAAWAALPIAGVTALGAVTGGGGAAAGGLGSAAATGMNAAGPAAAAAGAAGAADAGFSLANAPAFGSTATGVIPGSTVPAATSVGASASALTALKNLATTPKGVATIAALIPTLKNLFDGSNGSNGNSPFATGSPFMTSAQQSMDLANARTKEASPIYDALINQAYGQTPTRYRGAAPAGYPAGGDAAPAGAYQFTAPQFGGR